LRRPQAGRLLAKEKIIMCAICDAEYPAVRVSIGGQVSHPKNRQELEAAIGGSAVADSDLIPRDEDWRHDGCFCALNPGATAASAGVECDVNPAISGIALHFYK
jgi:hypothetical protein